MRARAYYEQSPAKWAALKEQLDRAGPQDRILLKGPTIVSVDQEVGDFDEGDLLIRGNRIEAIGPDLSAAASDGQAIVIEMGGMIVMPGLIDGHRHCWQNQFRRVIPDADLHEYVNTLHGDFAVEYRPHDMYVGNLLTMLTMLDSGITCIADCSHNTRTRAHADAVFKSYAESGIRAVHCGGPSNTGVWEEHLPQDLIRLRETYCSGADSLTSVRMFIDMRRVMSNAEYFAFAREHGFGVTMDGVMGQRCEEIVQMGRDGLLGPDLTLVHCNAMPEEGWKRIADAGTKITLATTSEQQLGLGDGIPVIQEALDHGIKPCLSADVEVCLAGDMFTQMRVTLNTQRMLAKARKYRGENNPPALISHRDVLAYTTRNAAHAVGLGDRIGTLTPGKYADLIAIRAEDLNNMPVNNAIGTIVASTENANIDMVFVAGKVRKWQGKVLGVDLNALRTLVKDSRDHIASRVGFEIHPTRNIQLKHDQIQHRHASNFSAIDDLLTRGT